MNDIAVPATSIPLAKEALDICEMDPYAALLILAAEVAYWRDNTSTGAVREGRRRPGLSYRSVAF